MSLHRNFEVISYSPDNEKCNTNWAFTGPPLISPAHRMGREYTRPGVTYLDNPFNYWPF